MKEYICISYTYIKDIDAHTIDNDGQRPIMSNSPCSEFQKAVLYEARVKSSEDNVSAVP